MPGSERRHYPRYDINVTSSIELMMPQETFTPEPFPATVQNISKGGMLIHIPDFPQETYKKMMRGVHYIKVPLVYSALEVEVDLIGKAVWLDYHMEDPDNVFLQLGISFEDLSKRQSKSLEWIIEDLVKQSNGV